MNIIFFSHSSKMYGAELALLDILKALSKEHKCTIFLPNEGPLVNKIKTLNNIEIEILHQRWWTYDQKTKIIKKFIIIILTILNILYLIYKINKIKKYKPDLIISNTAVIYSGLIYSIILDKPHLWFIHEFVKEDHGLEFILGEKKSLNIINKYSNKVIVFSRSLYNKYSKFIDKNNISFIYQYIKSSKNKKNDINNVNIFKILILGSISEAKGQYLAIEALDKLNKDNVKNIELYIAGSGSVDYINKLKTMTKNFNLDNKIHFVGYVENQYNLIKKIDIMLMLSKNEAFGRVTIEGMVCGKLIIASDSGANTEIIEDKKTGIIFRSGSSNDLYEKIKWAINNKEKIKEIGYNAKKDATEKFSNYQKYFNEIKNIILNIN